MNILIYTSNERDKKIYSKILGIENVLTFVDNVENLYSEMTSEIYSLLLLEVDEIEDYKLIIYDILDRKNGIYILQVIDTPYNDFAVTNALTLGIDDYVVKNETMLSIPCKIQRVLKYINNDESSEIILKKEMKFREYILNPKDRTFGTYNKKVELTDLQYLVLSYLLQKKNRIVSREELFNNFWKKQTTDPDKKTNITDVFVSLIRKNLKRVTNEDIIKTVRGVGYIVKDNDTR